MPPSDRHAVRFPRIGWARAFGASLGLAGALVILLAPPDAGSARRSLAAFSVAAGVFGWILLANLRFGRAGSIGCILAGLAWAPTSSTAAWALAAAGLPLVGLMLTGDPRARTTTFAAAGIVALASSGLSIGAARLLRGLSTASFVYVLLTISALTIVLAAAWAALRHANEKKPEGGVPP